MSAKSEDLLVLVDGSSYLYRAFHALPMLQNASKEHTGAVYGVVAMLRRLLDKYQPTTCAVVFDAKGKTFRDDLYPQYKANRPPMPDELRSQIAPLHEIIQAMGLPLLVVDGVEADDVIGTLARQASAQGRAVLISTGDKDLAQLVDQHVTLVNTMDDTMLDEAGVLAKFGVKPEQIVDYLALVGDSVDNIPGVPKVGPKTAAKWLQEYGTLDEIIAHAGDITGKIGDNLRNSLAQLPLSRELATIVVNLQLPVVPDQLQLESADNARLQQLFARMEFKTWLKDLLTTNEQSDNTEESAPTQAPSYDVVLTVAALEDWVARLKQAEVFVIDTETTSLKYMQARVVGVSVAATAGEAAYIPFGHVYPGAPDQLSEQTVLDALRPLLESEQHGKIGHNLKYDMSVLLNHGIELRGIAHDTMLESYVVDAAANRHDMDTLALKYLSRKTIHYEDVAGRGAKQITFDQVALEQAGPYAAEDAEVTLALHETLWPKVQAEPGLRELYTKIELPLIPVLSRIERYGVLIDREMLAHQGHELGKRLYEIEQHAYEAAGQKFNLASPKQIQSILFDQLGLPVTERTAKGQPSTAESVLEQLAEEYPLPRLILEYRSISKLKSTYVDKLPEDIDPATGRVHTSYHQAVAATGRLSSSDPNLQNIPVRTAEGRRIRKAFVAPAGCKLLSADYSQIELRIMAHLSGDAGLLEAFASGRDVHRATAAEVFGAAEDDVTADQRRAAKAINFGLIYGMSAFGLARQLGIDRTSAQSYVDLYFARYPGVKAFMDQTRDQAREAGYVETVFNRRLYLPEIRAANAQRRQYAERTAINAPMQGTAADIIKRAMIAVDSYLQDSGARAHIIMQVHDELVLEVAAEAVDEVREQVSALMSGAATLAVPLVVETGVGDNWDEAH
ncbi:MAG: DNA polymerase I [Gammaproteobacteria bacterium]|nr:DNA polymerase I [Gammaproteobacteria bacterium]